MIYYLAINKWIKCEAFGTFIFVDNMSYILTNKVSLLKGKSRSRLEISEKEV